MERKKYIQSIYFISSLLIFCYVLIRAYTVGITHDEVWTIDIFVPQTIINIFNYTPCDANNHILNTLFIKLFFQFGNDSLFIARLPNVLAFLLYLYFGFKISKTQLQPWVGLCCFLLLILNPFLLDFFGLARGYGLGLGFFLASLYFALKLKQDIKISTLSKSIGFGAIAVLCNFSILHFYLVLIFTINLNALIWHSKSNFKHTLLVSFIYSIILFAIIYEPLRKLVQNGNLYYGGNNNFYSDTLSSLSKYTIYNIENSWVDIYALNFFLTITFFSILFSFISNPKIYTIKLIILAITSCCILSLIIQHYAFGTLYLIDRTALFFYPLFIFCFCFSVNDFSHKIYSKIMLLTTIIFGANFLIHANLNKTAIWHFDAHSNEILKIINQYGAQNDRKIRIDYSWPFHNSIKHYLHKNK